MEIQQHLAGEPWCYLPRDILALTRQQVFDLYLRPKEATATVEVDGVNVPISVMSHRQLEYANQPGMTWLEFERSYQAHMRRLAEAERWRLSQE